MTSNTPTASTKPMPTFERELCSRCHGSGHYSYNSINGSTCFKCQGRKTTLTARSKQAQEWLRARLSTPVADLVPGMRLSTLTGRMTVVETQPSSATAITNSVTIPLTDIVGLKTTMTVATNGTVTRLATRTEMEAAIASQNSLPGRPLRKHG